MNANYRNALYRNAVAAMTLLGVAQPASADAITDWNDKAVAYAVSGQMAPPHAERMLAMAHLAMFDAVNSIEHKYRPYLVDLQAGPATSREAAAAAAAAAVLTGIARQPEGAIKSALDTYLAAMPDGAAKADGVRLGEAVAARILAARANDGADAPDTYRPRTTPGVYVPTASVQAPNGPASGRSR
jgi:hypothetical protein